MHALVQSRQHAGGRLRVALPALLILLCLTAAAAQTVIANSQLQTCIASGSVQCPQHLPSHTHGASSWQRLHTSRPHATLCV